MPIILNPPFKTLDSGLVFYAPLWAGELSISPFNSKDINKYVCTVTGAIWGIQGRAYDISGDDYINLSPAITTPTAGTLIGWFNWSGLAVTIGRDLHLTNSFYQHASNNFIYVYGSVVIFIFNPSINTWYHLAFTWTNAASAYSANLYVNGALRTKEQYADANIDNLSVLGNLSTTRGFYGIAGEYRLYSRVLSIAEIKSDRLQTKWRYQ